LQKLCRTGEKRLLQWRHISSHHICQITFLKSLLAAILFTILQDFMIQGGDPTGTGRGGTSIYGQKLYVSLLRLLLVLTYMLFGSEDELSPELRFTGAGILAMANSGPNTNGDFNRFLIADKPNAECKGSQFFITLAPTPYLDNKHTIFGRVSGGMRVVQRLGAVAVDAQDK
jgi:cyclophilin family peptidyl-prolyl cis-trans isomerase